MNNKFNVLDDGLLINKVSKKNSSSVIPTNEANTIPSVEEIIKSIKKANNLFPNPILSNVVSDKSIFFLKDT